MCSFSRIACGLGSYNVCCRFSNGLGNKDLDTTGPGLLKGRYEAA